MWMKMSQSVALYIMKTYIFLDELEKVNILAIGKSMEFEKLTDSSFIQFCFTNTVCYSGKATDVDETDAERICEFFKVLCFSFCGLLLIL